MLLINPRRQGSDRRRYVTRIRTSERIELFGRNSTISIDRWLGVSALYRSNAADL